MTERQFRKILRAFDRSVRRGYPPLNPDPMHLDLVCVFDGQAGGRLTLARKASPLA